MEEYKRSRSYTSNSSRGHNMMSVETYQGHSKLPPPPGTSYDLRSYSASYSYSHMGLEKDLQLEKGNRAPGASYSSKNWGFSDPEVQRKKRVAGYKFYSVEGKVKDSVRKSFRWLKDKYSKLIDG